MNLATLRFTALAATLALGPASGAQYTDVNATASTLSFNYSQMGSKLYGTFTRFVASLAFDTEHPEAAQASLSIDLDSINPGSEDAKAELRKPAWFNTADYPTAIFQSTRVEAQGDNRYLITGNLTLRGMTREVTVPVVLTSQSGIGIFDGALVIKRSDFKVGAGEWADNVVSDDIDVRFRMVVPQR